MRPTSRSRSASSSRGDARRSAGIARAACGRWTSTHDRLVGACYLDGSDIGAALIAAGLARDCPRYSGGRFADLETDAHRRLPRHRYCETKRR